MAPEIESPYRRKKTLGAMKISLDAEPVQQTNEEDKVDHRFD